MIMQNVPAVVNWWAILAPSLIVGLFTILVQLLLAFWLSKVTANYQKKISEKIEDYKKELNKELETHKVQLQSEFQTRFYEFQTRYSFFHQRKADAVEKMYEILIDLGTMVEHTFYKEDEKRKEEVQKTMDKYHEYIDFYLKHQLYFDDDLGNSIEEVRDLFSEMTDRYLEYNMYAKDSENNREFLRHKAEAGRKELEAHKNFRTEYPKLRIKLRDEFRSIISAENPSNKIKKTT
jgi:hypothetical protein